MYDCLALTYDLLHDGLTEDVAYCLALAGPASRRILELGCGSGRLLLPLAHAGHFVTGVDRSNAMLARALARLAAEPEAVGGRVRLVDADITRLPTAGLAGPFDLAIIAYNTLLHLEPGEVAAMLRGVRPLLAGGGRLFIDIENPFTLAAAADDPEPRLERDLTDPVSGATMSLYTAYRAIPGEQTIEAVWHLDPEDAGEAVTVRYHYLYPHELQLWLDQAGYRLAALAGDYAGSPFDEDSPRLLALATAAS